MSEDGASKFSLKNKKWRNRLFSTSEEPPPKQPPPKFNLNDDVADFLKPSTDRNPSVSAPASAPRAPRIDVASAQRWPTASDIGGASPSPGRKLTSSMRGRSDSSAIRLKKQLTVEFARTAPEVIGEGGDESQEPSIEVSRRKGLAPKGGEESQNHQDDFVLGMRSQDYHNGFGGTGLVEHDSADRRPHPRRRAQTSIGEISPPLQQKIIEGARPPTPPAAIAPGEGIGFRPAPIKRALTGFQGYGNAAEQPSPSAALPPPPAPPTAPQPRSLPGTNIRPPRPADALSGANAKPPQPPNAEDEEYFSPRNLTRTQTGFSPPVDDSDDEQVPMHFPDIKKQSDGPPKLPEMRKDTGFDFGFGDEGKSGEKLQAEPQNPGSFSARSRGRMRDEEGLALRQAADYRDLIDESPMRTESTRAPPPAPIALGRPNDVPMQQTRQSPPTSTGSITSPSSNYDATSPPVIYKPPMSPYQPYPSPRSMPAKPQSPEQTKLRPPLSPQPPLSARGTPSNFPPPSPSPYDQPSMTMGPQYETDAGSQKSSLSNSKADFSAGDLAMAEFGERVTHMQGIFRLTAEMERPMFEYTPLQYLRAAMWWFMRARTGLENLIRGRPRDQATRDDLPLAQPHVDLAKTWWILTSVIATHPSVRRYGDLEEPGSSLMAARHAQDAEMVEVYEVYDAILTNVKALLSSVQRNKAMPPTQSLIQGQDQSIWIKYPKYAPAVQTVLSGMLSSNLLADEKAHAQQTPTALMPLGDTKDDFCYGRMFVHVSISTDEAETDRVSMPCMLSILRARDDWRMKLIICSQSELVSVTVSPDPSVRPSWKDVQWKTKSRGLYVAIPGGFTLSVEFAERDFRQLWSIYEYTGKVERSIYPLEGEKVAHEITLRDFQYSDPSNPAAFPPDRVKRCMVRILERSHSRMFGNVVQRFHAGFRFVVVTSPKNKTLSSVSLRFGDQPLNFGFESDPQSGGAPCMTVRHSDPKKEKPSSMLLVFNDVNERGMLFSVLNGLIIGPDETVFSKVPLKAFFVAEGDQPQGFDNAAGAAMQRLAWQDLKVLNLDPDNGSSESPKTVLSDSLRIIARHSAGIVTDRLNLGEFLLLSFPTFQRGFGHW